MNGCHFPVLAFAIGAAVTACSADDSSGQGGTGGSGGASGSSTTETAPSDPAAILNQQCSPSQDPDTCYQCRDEQCCETNEACLNDEGCVAMKACGKGCSENFDGNAFVQCLDGCYTANEASYVPFAAHLACLTFECAEPCAGTLGSCLACSHQSCANEDIACRLDLGCTLLSDCYGQCAASDTACQEACEQGVPVETIQMVQEWILCNYEHCKDACKN